MTSLVLRDRNRNRSIFDSFFNDFYFNPFNAFDGHHRSYVDKSHPRCLVDSDENAYSISIVAVGVAREDINISLREGVITVSYKKEDKDNNNVFCSSFERSWTLPKDVDVDNITAKSNNGVLNVSIPRIQPVEPEVKKIDIV